MAAARAWRQQHNDVASELGKRAAPHPRSLTSMLANPRQALPPGDASQIEVPEGELEGESELVALNEDFAPLFQVASPLCEARRVGNRDSSSSRELLTDLFPSGFTSRTLSPSEAVPAAAAATADQPEPSSTNPLGEKEPELKGRHTWACLMPKAAAAPVAMASSTRKNGSSGGGEGEAEPQLSTDNSKEKRQRSSHLHPPWSSSQQLHDSSELQQPNHHGSDKYMCKIGGERTATSVETVDLGSPKEKNAITATRQVEDVDHDVLPRSNTTRISDSGGPEGVVTEAGATVRERENELKSALDRLAPRLVQSEERVKFLEGSLQQAKHAESGRNALIKQVTKLEEEVKHSRHRLEKRHAEALEWREKRQSLEADNSRLCAELHCALGRNTRLETENRRKDALLVEKNSILEAELRHKDQLLVEAEREQKRAWQTTNDSAETAQAAMVRAEVAAQEASDLRNLRNGASRQNSNRSNNAMGFALQEQSNRKCGQSLLDVVAASSASAATAADGGGGGGGPEATSRSWGPTESDRFSSVPLTGKNYRSSRTMSLSPERGRSVNHTVVLHPNEIVARAQNELGQIPTTGLREGISDQSKGASRAVPSQATVVATDYSSPNDVFVGEGGKESDPWWKDSGGLSPSKETQEAPTIANLTSSGPGRRVRAAETPAPAVRATGREHCHDGDRQRHDSEGVKGALTGATPAWTDAPSPLGGRSPTTVAGGCGDGGVGSASSIGFLRRDHVAAGRPRKDYQLHEEIHIGDKKCQDPGKVCSGYDGGTTVGEVELWGEERARNGVRGDDPAVDESSAMSRGGKLPEAPPQGYPAAGHTRGRDLMSSRRCSLSGAGVGVTATTGEANETSRIDPTGSKPQMSRVHPTDDGDSSDAHDVNRDAFDGRQRTGGSAEEYDGPPSTAAPVYLDAVSNRSSTDRSRLSVSDGRRSSEPGLSRSTEEGSVARSSVAPTQRTVSFASMLGNRSSPGSSDKDAKARRERGTSAPFATDAAEDELRPVREVERRLMLLQMETSQLEAEQSKLVPKASKTMQARVQMQKIDSRLALLANESSGLRRVLREKPWTT